MVFFVSFLNFAILFKYAAVCRRLQIDVYIDFIT